MLNHIYDSYNVRKSDIDRLLFTFAEFDTVKNAVELFMKMEGSFVGRTALVPVLPENMDEKVPITFEQWDRLRKKKLIKEVLISNHASTPLDELERIHKPAQLLKYVAAKGVYAFKISCVYSDESGLLLEEGVDYE